jgi:8-oxo-dGTP diphosphatase
MSVRAIKPCRTAEGVPSSSSGTADGLRPGSCAQHPVTVVRALASRGESVLMVRRDGRDSLGGCWELPGGKVNELEDRTEYPLEALARELDEECGLKLRGAPRLIASAPRVSPNGKPVHELTYLAEVTDGAARLSYEHDRVRWHPLHEPVPGQLTEAAAEVLAALRARASA